MIQVLVYAHNSATPSQDIVRLATIAIILPLTIVGVLFLIFSLFLCLLQSNARKVGDWRKRLPSSAIDREIDIATRDWCSLSPSYLKFDRILTANDCEIIEQMT